MRAIVRMLVLVTAAAGAGVGGWVESRDRPFDEAREIAAYRASPPNELTVPPDVALAEIASGEKVDPRVFEVSLGKSTVRVGGRVAFTFPPRSSAPSVPPRLGALFPPQVASMVAWGRKLNVAVERDPTEANVLVDEDATYGDVTQLLHMLGQAEVTRANLVVRTPAGLGALRSRPRSISDGRRLSHSVCISPDEVRLDPSTSRRDSGAPMHAERCGWSGGGWNAPAYRACFAKLEGFELGPERDSSAPPMEITVGATADVRFGRALLVDTGLADLGLMGDWGAPCDAAGR